MMGKWEMVRLGDVLNYEQPTKYIVQSTNYNDNYDIPVLTAGQSFILGYTDEQENIFSENLPVIIFDDFTTAIQYVDFPFKVKSSAMKILNAQANADIKYLYYYMSIIRTDTKLHKRYWISKYSNIKIPLPPLNIQQKITEILDSTNALIEKRKEQIAKLDLLVKSQFVEMFGDPVRNPMGWEDEPLSTHLRVVGGYAFDSNGFKDTGIPVLRIGNINTGSFSSKNLVFWQYDKKLDRYLLFPNDIVISLTGTVGKDDYANICILGSEHERYYLNQRNAKLELRNTLNDLFLANILRIPEIKKKLTGISRGVRQANVSNSDILNIKLPIPPLELQNRFADFVRAVDESKAKMQRGLEELELLYKSLMQKCFSGEIV